MKRVFPVLTSVILLGITSAATCFAQEGDLDPTIRSGATEKVSEHVYLIPDEKQPLRRTSDSSSVREGWEILS